MEARVFWSGCSAADYDNDGHVDLYLLNYGSNILYHNNGDGTFTDVTDKAGLAVNRWSMSAVWFDYNNDGCSMSTSATICSTTTASSATFTPRRVTPVR